MNLCKQASAAACGKQCCCIECEERSSCESVCTTVEQYETCEDLFQDTNAIQKFETAVPNALMIITDVLQQKKVLEETEKKMKDELLTAMKQYGIKSFKSDSLELTYIAPTTKTAIDSKKLKAEKPEIAEQYSKTSSVKENIRIKLKDS